MKENTGFFTKYLTFAYSNKLYLFLVKPLPSLIISKKINLFDLN